MMGNEINIMEKLAIIFENINSSFLIGYIYPCTGYLRPLRGRGPKMYRKKTICTIIHLDKLGTPLLVQIPCRL